MNKAHNRLKKPLALLLALIMLLGMMVPAFADNNGTTGSVTGGQAPPNFTLSGGGTDWLVTENPSGNSRYSPFSRYTLAYFPEGVAGDNWKSGYVISMMDISPVDYTVPINSFYTNALWYRQNGEHAIDYAMLDNWANNGYVRPGFPDGVTFTSFVRREADIFGDTLPCGASTDFVQFTKNIEDNGLSVTPDGMLRYMFTENQDGEVQAKYNDAFTHLIKALGAKAVNEVPSNTMAQALATYGADVFVGDDNYRLIVEPGIVVQNSGQYFALTLRDAAAYSYYMGETDSSSADKSSLSYSLTRYAAWMMGLPLYELKDSFTEIQGNEVVSVSHAFLGAKENDLPREYPNLRFKGLRRILFGKGANASMFAPYNGATWAEGEYAPYGMGIMLPKMAGDNTGLTVTKAVEGENGDKDALFLFNVALTNLPDGATVTSSGDHYFTWEADKGLATFYLKDGESCPIYIGGLGEDDKVGYAITEPEAAGMGYATTFLTDGDGFAMVSGTITAQQNIAVTVTNTKNDVSDGVAHLIIDYNLNGTIATTGQGASDTVDCGAIPFSYTDPTKNVVNDITPMMDGTALYKGYTVTETVGSATVTMTYKGLFDAPKGGNEVKDSYLLQHDGLTILYAQWDISATGGDTTPDPTSGGDLYTIFWDYNYYGAAVTSSLAGSFKIHKTLSCSTSPTTGVHHVNYNNWEEITVSLPFAYDGVVDVEATRDGYIFEGWSLSPDGEVLTKENFNLTPEDTTVYAIWTPKAYRVTLEMKGSTIIDLSDNENLDTYDPTAVYDVDADTWTVTVLFDTVYGELPTPTKPNCVYRGYRANGEKWPSTDEFGPSIHDTVVTALSQYIDFTDYDNDPNNGINKGITLTAVMEPYFTFDPDGGKFEDETETPKKILQSDIDKLPDVTKDGYEHDGWLDSEGNKVSLDDIKAKTEPEVLRPNYVAKATLDANQGKVNGKDTETVALNDALTKFPTPDRSGYVFDGWYTEPDSGKRVTLEDLKAANEPVTIYAHWTVRSYGGGSSGGGRAPAPAPLLTGKHIAYIIGRSDGLVHPEANITRAEVATIFYRLLTNEARSANQTTENPFEDVEDGSWYAKAVCTLAKMGIIKGRGGNVFDPDAEITRAELAVIAARFDKLESGAVTFPDVPTDHWAYAEINSAATKGWVLGRGDGTFAPDTAITRAEVVTLINRVLNRASMTLESIVTTDHMTVWPDNMDTSAWYYLAMQEATNEHNHKMDGKVEYWTSLLPISQMP